MNILDTDSLSILQRGGGGDVYERLATRLDAVGAGGVHVTIVSFEEQMRGWLAFIARAKNMTEQLRAYDRLLAFVDDFRLRPVLPFDERAAVEFQRLRKSKLRIGTMDLKIAAVVLARGATLISRNLADFRQVPGLRVEDWTVPPTA